MSQQIRTVIKTAVKKLSEKELIAASMKEVEKETAGITRDHRAPKAEPVQTIAPPKGKKALVHLKPREAKSFEGTMRKEVLLTLPVLDRLQKQADRIGTPLKKYLEMVLIKAASETKFDINVL